MTAVILGIVISTMSVYAYTPTPYAMNFYGYVTLDGSPVIVGTSIQAFDPQGIECGNWTVAAEGKYGLLPCYGDDSTTAPDEGAIAGDSIIFKVNGYTATVTGTSVWANMGQEYLNLTAKTEVTIDIPLETGWNLISIPLESQDTSVANVLSSIEGDYSRVMAYDNGYLTYDPTVQPEFNTLNNITHKMGFWIKMDIPGILSVNGTSPDDITISLNTGWNLISYLNSNNQTVSDALTSIAGNYSRVMAYENGYLTYDPAIDPAFNTLTIMEQNGGYWIKAENQEVLQY